MHEEIHFHNCQNDNEEIGKKQTDSSKKKLFPKAQYFLRENSHKYIFVIEVDVTRKFDFVEQFSQR